MQVWFRIETHNKESKSQQRYCDVFIPHNEREKEFFMMLQRKAIEAASLNCVLSRRCES